LLVSKWSLPGLGIGKITAFCQDCGISVIAKIAVYLLFSRLYSKLRRRNNTAWSSRFRNPTAVFMGAFKST